MYCLYRLAYSGHLCKQEHIIFFLLSYFQGSTLLQYVSGLQHFLWLNNIPLVCYTVFYLSIYPLLDVWVTSALAVVNNLVMNSNVQVFVLTYIFTSFSICVGLEFLGLMKYVTFLRKSQIVFQMGFTILYSHHKYVSVLISPHSHRNFVLSAQEVCWNFTVALIRTP